MSQYQSTPPEEEQNIALTDLSLDKRAESLPVKEPAKKLSSDLLPHKQEETRAWLAKRLIDLVTWTIFGTFLLIVTDKVLVALDRKTDSQASRELITLIWTSQATLVGSALGFYFGNQKSGKSDD